VRRASCVVRRASCVVRRTRTECKPRRCRHGVVYTTTRRWVLPVAVVGLTPLWYRSWTDKHGAFRQSSYFGAPNEGGEHTTQHAVSSQSAFSTRARRSKGKHPRREFGCLVDITTKGLSVRPSDGFGLGERDLNNSSSLASSLLRNKRGPPCDLAFESRWGPAKYFCELLLTLLYWQFKSPAK